MTQPVPAPDPAPDPADATASPAGSAGAGSGAGPVSGSESGPGAGSESGPGADAAPTGPSALSDRDRAVLGVERQGWPGPGAKERAIRERLGMSPTRYYQLLGALLDDPRAAEYDPVTLNRLRRVRDARRDRR